ncbi:MAG: FkbM family methyltransferase [Pseudomonadota bacterium]
MTVAAKRSPEDNARMRAALSAAMKSAELTSFAIADLFFQYLKKTGQLKNKVFADVGANLGAWTYPFAQRYWRVYAFEAYSRNFEALTKKFAAHEDVKLIRRAVWNESGAAFDFYYNEARPGIGSLKNNSEHFREDRRETVETITIANALGEDLQKLELIKADVEGAELQALQGADLARSQPRLIIVEISGRSDAFGYHADDLADYITAASYRPYLVAAREIETDAIRRKFEVIHFAPYAAQKGKAGVGANMDIVAVREDAGGEFEDLFAPHFRQHDALT